MVRLAINEEKTIKASDAIEGMLYVITCWTCDEHIGKVVVRYEDKLYILNSSTCNRWYAPGLSSFESCKLRKIKKGEMLTVD